MKLKVVSDIHLEFIGARAALPDICDNTDAIGLLGDIGNPLKPEYREFLWEMSDRFGQVFVVAGNHEYYANEVSLTNRLIESICAQRDNLHFLNASSVKWGDFLVLGATLWAYAPPEHRAAIEAASTDHHKIISRI
jgi:predicted phosphodiesterase